MTDEIDLFRDGRKPTPEHSLWSSVVLQAVLDLFATPKGGSWEPEGVRLDAMQWLTAETGEDADSRACVCALAGVDADALRQRVIAMLDGQPSTLDAARLEDARALWRSHRDRPKVRRLVFTASTQPEVIGQDGPFSINSLGALFCLGNDLPAGRWRGSHYIPSTRTGAGKVLYALTRPRGGTVGSLRRARPKDWESLAADLCEKFALDLVWLRNGEPSTEADPDAKAYLIPRPIETSKAA